MGRNVSFNRLVSLRNEIFDLGAAFCYAGKTDGNAKPSFQTNREMLDFLWNVRCLTYEACAEHGFCQGWWSYLQNVYSEWESVRNAIANRYMFLVKSVARKYGHRNQDFADLFQEGAKGLLRALDSFEVDYGVPFETYARPWIKKYLSQCVECHSEVIRLPETLAKKRRKSRHDFSAEESFREGECRCEIVYGSKEASMSFSNVSSNENLICNLEVADQQTNPEQSFWRQKTVRFLNQCVESLDPDAQKVLNLRYLSEDEPSLEETGEKCGFSREKTRKIEKKALDKLRKKLQQR